MLGKPNEKIQNEIRNHSLIDYMSSQKLKRQSWEELIPNAPPEAIDLISKLLTWDPADRLTASEAIKHPFLADIYDDPEDYREIVQDKPINFFDFEFEQYTLNQDILKELILDEIILYHSPSASIFNKRIGFQYP